MPKPIVLKKSEWDNLEHKIKQENPPSVYMIRSKMREVLGFTVRKHAMWIDKKDDIEWKVSNGNRKGYYRDEIHLDFYDESKRTFFIMKYM